MSNTYNFALTFQKALSKFKREHGVDSKPNYIYLHPVAYDELKEYYKSECLFRVHKKDLTDEELDSLCYVHGSDLVKVDSDPFVDEGYIIITSSYHGLSQTDKLIVE